jgi:hypothetical protein
VSGKSAQRSVAPICASPHGVLVERAERQPGLPGGERTTHDDAIGLELARRQRQEPQQADENAVLEIVASLGTPIQNIAILSLIVLVQVSWLLALGYAVLRFTL